MNMLYFDCFTGISGDMCLGALIDAGADARDLEHELRKLPLENWSMTVEKKTSHGISGTGVTIQAVESNVHRHLADIEKIIDLCDYPQKVRNDTVKIFRRLADAESKVHGMPVEHVHFHEVGAVDSIIDITGTVLALHMLGTDCLVCSPLPTGTGSVVCRHGIIPVPAPATSELLKGVPLRNCELEAELVTPTGAAIATTLSERFGALPSMTIRSVGYGFGSRKLDRPNFLRAFMGTAEMPALQAKRDTVSVMETVIDDMNPEFYGYLMEMLFEGGALDVYLQPVQMKKNRPATAVTVLCRSTSREALAGIILSETTTLGVRFRDEQRFILPRSVKEVETPFGRVRVKFVDTCDSSPARYSPEYDDCKKIAASLKIPLRQVYLAAMMGAEELS